MSTVNTSTLKVGDYFHFEGWPDAASAPEPRLRDAALNRGSTSSSQPCTLVGGHG